jgi:hypothetical protein
VARHRVALFVGLLFLLLGGLLATSGYAQAPARAVEVLVLGCDHLNQLYTGQDPRSDVFSPKKQAELAQLRARLRRFRPALVLVEAEPKEQPQLDSLYAAYQQGNLQFTALPYGRSERYQIGFALAKELHLPAPQGVDYTAATSQGLLSTGRNIVLFRQGLQQLQATARPLKRQVQHDSLSVYDYLAPSSHCPKPPRPAQYACISHERYVRRQRHQHQRARPGRYRLHRGALHHTVL